MMPRFVTIAAGVRKPSATTGRSWVRYVLFAAFIAFALMLFLDRAVMAQGSADERVVKVVDGEGLTHVLPLSEDTTASFSTSFGDNTITIEGGAVRMVSSTCPNHDCVDFGSIESGAAMILCLPNRLLVSIEDGTDRLAEPDAVSS